MRKSKIVLLFKILIVVLLLVSVIKVFSFNLSYKLFKSNKSNRGTITFITKKSDYTVINIKSNINYKAYIYDKNDIDYGDIIYFEYQNKEVTNNTIPNIFNYKNYLKSKNINQVITISRYKKLGKNNYYKFKGVIYKKILSRKSKNYILTFLCGDKSYLDNDIKRSYTSNGISHLLCISGFHIMFVFSFLKKILRYLCKNENVINFVLIIFSILYLVLTSFMIALFRSILMYFLNYFNKK